MANSPRRARRQQTAAQQMLYGIVLAALGVVLTVVSKVIAANTGSSYSVVFTGLIIVGAIYAIIGLFRLITKR